MSKKILLITEDQKTAAAVRDALADYQVEVAAGVDQAFTLLRSLPADLTIVDHDLKGVDGLQLCRQIKLAAPAQPLIMLSAGNDIPLAVAAAKIGVGDFFRKPPEAKALQSAVGKNLTLTDRPLLPPGAIDWLQSEGQPLRGLFQQIKEALLQPRNLIIHGEIGINKQELAAYIHEQGAKSRRQFLALDLASFRREDQEASFWAGVQELLALPRAGAAQTEEDRCGTLYLGGIETLAENFRLSVLEFFQTRKANLDQEIMVIIGLVLPSTGQLPAGYTQLIVPPLRERKEDLNRLLLAALREQAARFNKPLKGFSAAALDFLTLYDYPGNYRELECIVESAVAAVDGDLIGLKELPLDEQWAKTAAAARSRLSGRTKPAEVKLTEEKILYQALLAKFNNDLPAIARWLDIPRTTLAARLEELGCYPAD